jgi:hypothetical protein
MGACTPWATIDDAPASYEGDPDVLESVLPLATDILFELTRRRWPGTCHDEFRPMAQYRSAEMPTWWPDYRGSMGWCSCNRALRETGCQRLPEIKLPGTPVHVDSIKVTLDGAAFTDFALHDHRYLVRTDGDGWPCCQDLLAPLTEDHTMGIEYDFGIAPPEAGPIVCMAYAIQLALSLDAEAVASNKCQLPKRVTTITRQGITMAILDPMVFIDKGRVGLALVDQWIASVNLGSNTRAATVLVPGQRRTARRIE